MRHIFCVLFCVSLLFISSASFLYLFCAFFLSRIALYNKQAQQTNNEQDMLQLFRKISIYLCFYLTRDLHAPACRMLHFQRSTLRVAFLTPRVSYSVLSARVTFYAFRVWVSYFYYYVNYILRLLVNLKAYSDKCSNIIHWSVKFIKWTSVIFFAIFCLFFFLLHYHVNLRCKITTYIFFTQLRQILTNKINHWNMFDNYLTNISF